jgi:hypothetical protein
MLVEGGGIMSIKDLTAILDLLKLYISLLRERGISDTEIVNDLPKLLDLLVDYAIRNGRI